jgi:hypothetical protein
MSKKTADAPTMVADPVESARAEVVRLNDQELRLAMLYRQKAGELAGVKAERGDQVLAAADPAGAARKAGQHVSVLLEELESFADASRRARELRLAAIPAVYQAEASEKERQSEQLEAEATKLEAESGRLRAALQRHDDWPYVPAAPVIPERMIGEQRGGASVIVDARGPRHERLRWDAKALRTQAGQGRYKVAHQAGSLQADTLEELLGDVHSDAMRVGPPIDAIVSWSEKAIENERRRRARLTSTADSFVPADAPMRLLLEWRGGVIDQAQSRVIQPEPPEVAWPLDPRPAVATPAAKPAPDPRVRSPFATGPTAYEIRREAAATGKPVEEIAAAWGVPVPELVGEPAPPQRGAS